MASSLDRLEALAGSKAQAPASSLDRLNAVRSRAAQQAPQPAAPSGIPARGTLATALAGPALAFTPKPQAGSDPRKVPEIIRDPEQRALSGQRPLESFMEQKVFPGTERFATRGTFEAAGGTAGTIAGAGAGPVPALAGSIIGSAGGSALYDFTEDLIRWIYGLEQPSQGFQRFQEVTNNALTAGAFDAFSAALLPMIAPVAKAIPRFFTGVGPQRAGDIANAQAHGLEPTPRMVGGRAGAFSSATGRLPFAGTSRDTARMSKQIDALLDRVASQLGPDLTRDEAANVLAMGGFQRAQTVMKSLGQRFDDVERTARAMGNPAAFPADAMAAAGREYRETIGQQAFVRDTRRVVPGDATGEMTVTLGERVKIDLPKLVRAKTAKKFLIGASQLAEAKLTYPQLKALREAGRRLKAGTGPTVPGGPAKDPTAHAALGRFLSGVTDALDNATVPELAKQAQDANRSWAAWKTFINQPGFSEFRAAVPGVATRTNFERPRSKEMQDVLDMFSRERSPQVLESIRALTGDEAFGSIRRRALMNAISESVAPIESGGLRLHVGAMRANLGLTTRDGQERLKALLQGSDVAIRDLQRFTDALETVGDQFLPEVSQFMLRNLMLRTAGGGARGGVHGLLGSMLAAGAGGAAAVTGGVGSLLSGTIGTLIPLRLINEGLASRRVLNWLTRGVEEYNAAGPWQHSFRRAMQILEFEERDRYQGEQEDAPVVN